MSYQKIKSIQDAYEACGLSRDFKADVSSFPEEYRRYMANHFDRVIVCKAINKRDDGTFWSPDWSNTGQYKWEIIVGIEANNKIPSGSGFSFAGYDLWLTVTYAGSRLCFETREQAEYAFENFQEILKVDILILG